MLLSGHLQVGLLLLVLQNLTRLLPILPPALLADLVLKVIDAELLNLVEGLQDGVRIVDVLLGAGLLQEGRVLVRRVVLHHVLPVRLRVHHLLLGGVAVVLRLEVVLGEGRLVVLGQLANVVTLGALVGGDVGRLVGALRVRRVVVVLRGVLLGGLNLLRGCRVDGHGHVDLRRGVHLEGLVHADGSRVPVLQLLLLRLARLRVY